MTELTFLTLLTMILGATTRLGYARALALGGVPVAGAAVVSGETAVPVFYFVSLGALIGAALMWNRRGVRREQFLSHRSPPALGMLFLLFLWCVLITVMAPLMLDGHEVVANGELSYLRAGQVTTSNLAQLIYVALGIAVVAFLVYAPNVRPEIVGLAVCGTVVLSFWRYLHVQYAFPFPDGVFDNSPAYNFIETEAGGGRRFRGILTEPAGLGSACLAALAYTVARVPKVKGKRKVGCLLVAAAALFMGMILLPRLS